MDEKAEAFKRGFAAYCFDAGMDTEKAAALIAFGLEKQAGGWGRFLANALGRSRTALRSAGKSISNYFSKSPGRAAVAAGAAGAGTAGPIGYMTANVLPAAQTAGSIYGDFVLPASIGIGGALGLGAGHVLGNAWADATDTGEDAEQIKAKELADTYRAYADRARRQKEL